MKKEDLIQALNEIDDDLLESVQRQRMESPKKKPVINRPLIGLITAACVIVFAAVSLRKDPETAGGNLTMNTPAATEKEDEPADSSLKTISISRDLESSGSAGFSIVMYPDLTKEKDYNPWNEEMNLKTLPVFERRPSSAGIPYGLTEKEMTANLEQFAMNFDFTADRTEKYTSGFPSEEDPEGDDVYEIVASGRNGHISSDGYGELVYSWPYMAGAPLPEGISLAYEQSEEDAVSVINYLHDLYGYLLSGENWSYDIGGDYTFDGRQVRKHMIYATGDSDEETILNYNFSNIQFAGSDDGTRLELIRLRNELSAYDRIGDYPLISVKEAYDQLYAGNCFANTNGVRVTEETPVADVQLEYLNYRSFRYVIPCYVFLADITDEVNSFMVSIPENLRSYGLYYVPAVDPSYLEWTDGDQTAQIPDENETTADPASESTTMPVTDDPLAASSFRSGSVSVERIIQKESYYCAAACGQMILDHFGIQVDQTALAKEMNTYKPGERSDGITGTYDSDVARVLNDYLFNGQPQNASAGGYRVQSVSDSFVQSEYDQFVSRMEKNIDEGYPSIVQIRTGSLYGTSGNENHNLLVTGYEVSGNTHTLTLMDPYFDGPEGSGQISVNASELFEAIVESVEPSYIW